MSTIIQRLEDSGYKPTEAQLREFLKLARSTTRVSGAVEGGYFKVLLTRSMDLSSVKMAHDELYPIVKEECITEGMTAQERNKATNFARSAYSTLAKATKAGYIFGPHDTKQEIAQWVRSINKPKHVEDVILSNFYSANFAISSGAITRQRVVEMFNRIIVGS